MDIKRQYKELALARTAAEIAGNDNESISRDEMERFLYDLFTNEHDAAHYSDATELGINIRVSPQ